VIIDCNGHSDVLVSAIKKRGCADVAFVGMQPLEELQNVIPEHTTAEYTVMYTDGTRGDTVNSSISPGAVNSPRRTLTSHQLLRHYKYTRHRRRDDADERRTYNEFSTKKNHIFDVLSILSVGFLFLVFSFLRSETFDWLTFQTRRSPPAWGSSGCV